MIESSRYLMEAAVQRGKAAGHALLILLLCAGAVCGEVSHSIDKAEEHVLPLPRWSEQELKVFRDSLPGAGSQAVVPPKNGEVSSDINDLIRTPLSSGPRLDHFFNDQDSELSPRLQASDVRLFLPEAILGLPSQIQPGPVQLPTPLTALKDVSPEFLTACRQSLPGEFLIDPDQLVPEIQNHDMLRLLGFHAQDARIKLYVLMLAHDQKFPEGADLDKVASGSLLKSDSCLVVYPLGEPWRTRLFVSRSVHNQISAEFLSETIQACLQEALQTSNAHDQLRRYTIHLSTRLFWLQKALGTEPAVKTDNSHSLAEFGPLVKAPAVSSTPGVDSSTIWSSGSLLMLGLAVLSLRGFARHLRLRRHRRIWMLAEPDTVPRLGGAFTGGGGAMIRYA